MDMTRSYWTGPEATHRRTMLKASGYGDKDIKRKPHIGVANSFMEGSPGSAHLRQIGEAVKQGIWAGGGIPFEFGIPATCGNVANGAEELKYELAGRDAVAMSIEFVTKVHNFDGLVLIASCDNIIAGAYLAACRLGLPVIVVTGGSMLTGHYCGKKIVEAELDVATLKLQKDNIDKNSDEYKAEIKRLEELEEFVCPSFGACPSMGTANTMQMLGEVFNLVIPGTANIPAADNLKIRKSREAGEFIVDLTKRGVTPKELITRETLLNAIMVDMAIAGSTNAVLHILSMAKELDLDITMEDFNRLAQEIPCITGVIPSGPYSIEDFYRAGGMPVVMKMLESKLYTDVPTMFGTTWKDVLSLVKAESTDIIRSLDKPLFNEPGLKVLYGNLSPNGAIIRPTGVPAEMKTFRGVAKCFDHEMDCFAAIQKDEIKPGDVLIIRYEGCKGAPGMKELMVTTDALVAHGLHKSVGLISDARFSGFNHGAIVGHVTPEAYDGGPIALVKDGDIISVDVNKGTINIEVSDEELAERRKNWVRPEPKVKKGMLALYAALCKPADEGGAMQNW